MVPVMVDDVSRGRKRHLEGDLPLFQKRNSNSDLSDDDSSASRKSGSPSIDDDRRAHHNELERRRRDHIKDHFMTLKEAIPLLEGEKSSRALILKRAVEYIAMMQSRLQENQIHIDELKRRNEQLSAGIREQTHAVAEPTPSASAPFQPLSTSSNPSPFRPIAIESIGQQSAPALASPSSPPSTNSSFSPVVSAKTFSPLRFPLTNSVPDLAALLGLKMDPVPQKDVLSDLQQLLTINSLALKEQQQFLSPSLIF